MWLGKRQLLDVGMYWHFVIYITARIRMKYSIYKCNKHKYHRQTEFYYHKVK